MANCNTCNRELDREDDLMSEDCGGDCLQCMANAGDPECMEAVAQLEPDNDVCYYCGEDMDDDGPCSENEGKPHESQRKVDEQINRIYQRRQQDLEDLARKMKTTRQGEEL